MIALKIHITPIIITNKIKVEKNLLIVTRFLFSFLKSH